MVIQFKDLYTKIYILLKNLTIKKKYYLNKKILLLLLKKKINIYMKVNIKMVNKMVKVIYIVLFNSINLVSIQKVRWMEIVIKWLWIGERYHKVNIKWIKKLECGKSYKIMVFMLKQLKVKKQW